MIFSEVEYENKILGYASEADGFLYFFGTENTSLELLQLCYPNLVFYKIKQVHGDKLIPCSVNAATADAHWTSEVNQALIIATADCVPILISHKDFVCAVHAGWRGVENNVLLKSVTLLLKKFTASESLTVVMGPHIEQNSFEVDHSLGLKFQEQYHLLGGSDNVQFPNDDSSGKTFVDLKKILILQLNSIGLSRDQIFEFSADTKTDLRFSSFRRQKEKSGRNLSFVSRLNK